MRRAARARRARHARSSCCAPATGALPPLYKAHKWLVTRGDLDYTALWILYAATSLAQIEVIGAGLVADREVIPQAMKLNPAFFETIYTDLLNTQEDAGRSVAAALERWTHISPRARPSLFAPVLAYLREAGEARSCTRDREPLQAALRHRRRRRRPASTWRIRG